MIDKIGFIGILAFPGLGLGVALLLAQKKIAPADRSKPQLMLGWTAALTASTVLLITSGNAFLDARRPTDTTIAGDAGITAAPSVPAQPSLPVVPAPGIAVSSGTGCPKPDPTDPSLPPVEVKVVYWCKGDVFTKKGEKDPANIQIKLRPRLVNNTSSSLSISIGKPSAVRLLVTGKQIDQRWSPPPLTKANGDRPILVNCNGQTYWAIPPNVPHDASKTNAGYYTGFSTSWSGSSLSPGGSYWKPLRIDSAGTPTKEGNLVFQVPTDSKGEVIIYGLAVIDEKRRSTILGLAVMSNPEQWGPALHPAAF
ncbi:hypothetical protein ACQPYV_22725 [Micromonospora saelicesensis]|uniref:hypothetical protein n=1 Tax=Micromonospora saelicesensis TaxID=285676 RepID=UPI003D8CC054